MNPKTVWAFDVTGNGTDTLELAIYDVISGGSWGGVSAKDVLNVLKMNPTAKDIRVRINSQGGEVSDGLAIYNLLHQHSAKVTVDIDGMAASIASVIAMAGNERRISAVGTLMIHNPWSMAAGDGDAMRKCADVLDLRRDQLAQVYSARTGQPIKAVVKAMADETYMNAETAKELGYVDTVVPLLGPTPEETAALGTAQVFALGAHNVEGFVQPNGRIAYGKVVASAQSPAEHVLKVELSEELRQEFDDVKRLLTPRTALGAILTPLVESSAAPVRSVTNDFRTNNSGVSTTELCNAVREALVEKLNPKPEQWVWVRDVYDDKVVYEFENVLWQYEYSFDAKKMKATLSGEPQRVRVEYVPISDSATTQVTPPPGRQSPEGEGATTMAFKKADKTLAKFAAKACRAAHEKGEHKEMVSACKGCADSLDELIKQDKEDTAEPEKDMDVVQVLARADLFAAVEKATGKTGAEALGVVSGWKESAAAFDKLSAEKAALEKAATAKSVDDAIAAAQRPDANGRVKIVPAEVDSLKAQGLKDPEWLKGYLTAKPAAIVLGDHGVTPPGDASAKDSTDMSAQQKTEEAKLAAQSVALAYEDKTWAQMSVMDKHDLRSSGPAGEELYEKMRTQALGPRPAGSAKASKAITVSGVHAAQRA